MVTHAGERLYELQKQSIKTDVTFTCEGTEVKCHKLVIDSFGGPLAKLIDGKEGEITINDINLHTFRTIIQ